jgi:hypothetical protein
MDKITINMASLPDRNWFASRTVESLHDQCDVMNVFLNNYGKAPEWFSRYPKCVTWLTDNEMGDSERYRVLPDEGWLLTVDDDIVYPPTYVSDMISAAERYGRKAIVTLHGNIMRKDTLVYHGPDARDKTYRCLGTVEEDVRVEVGGTGVMCFHTEIFKPDLKRFARRNMADIWVAVQAHQQKIPIWVIKHEAGYLQYQLPPDKWTIWKDTERNLEATTYQASVINKYLRDG